ncbi:MAG TPA: fatty acid desaturase [Saprospiraceae bacterium]|nr:fatty acid desaturase [Saprospiraceae bacterium]
MKEFLVSQDAEPHIGRTREIIKKYPQIKELMGRNPMTFAYIVGVVSLQLVLAYVSSGLAWYWVLLMAYAVGAFANHALFTLIHECAHNMVFKSRVANLWAGILCDIPNGFPSSVQFRKYHLKHHAFQGHYDIDADIPSVWEAKLIGNSFVGKAIWLLFFPIFQLTRPPRLKEVEFNSLWMWIDLFVVLAVDVLLFYFFGLNALLYLMASFFFSVGLHPLGGRWIQEHYLVAAPQETYSYYGPLNILAFNVGYHNEHHDFSYIPWNKLPEIKAIAPEFYDNLVSHTSWSSLVWKFLTDKNMSLYSRTIRENKGGINVTRDSESDFTEGIRIKESQTV